MGKLVRVLLVVGAIVLTGFVGWIGIEVYWMRADVEQIRLMCESLENLNTGE